MYFGCLIWLLQVFLLIPFEETKNTANDIEILVGGSSLIDAASPNDRWSFEKAYCIVIRYVKTIICPNIHQSSCWFWANSSNSLSEQWGKTNRRWLQQMIENCHPMCVKIIPATIYPLMTLSNINDWNLFEHLSQHIHRFCCPICSPTVFIIILIVPAHNLYRKSEIVKNTQRNWCVCCYLRLIAVVTHRIRAYEHFCERFPESKDQHR